MSQKRKNQRAKHELQEEKQAKKVVTWIFVALIVLGLLCMATFFSM